MLKNEFINELNKRLYGIPENDLAERIGFYEEIINDSIEEGMSEEEAVASVGTAKSVAEQILSEYPISKLVKEKVRPKRKPRAWETVLIIVGSPLWIPLGLVAVAVILALICSAFAVVAALWVCDLSLLLGGIGSFAFGVYTFLTGNDVTGFACVGAGIFAVGLSIFMYFGCFYLTKGIVKLIKISIIGIKHSIVGKEEK